MESAAHSDNSSTQPLKSSGNEKRFACEYCNLGFSYMANLKEHVRVHTGEKPYSCAHCLKSFKRSGHLTRHMRIHERNMSVINLWEKIRSSEPIEKSNEGFHCATKMPQPSMENLDNPYSSKSGACNTIGNTDTKTDEFAHHSFGDFELKDEQLQSHASLDEKSYKLNLSLKLEPVETCSPEPNDVPVSMVKNVSGVTADDALVEPGHLTSKIMSPTDEVQHKTCLECGQKFTLLSSLRRHLKIHTGDKPYQCSYCTKTFPLQGYLRDHERTHGIEKPYGCKHCDKKFSKPRRLLYHLRTHTGEKPYACKLCTKSFAQPSALGIHMRTHTGVKLFTCGECGRKFSQSSNLVTHMRVHECEKLDDSNHMTLTHVTTYYKQEND